MIGTSITAQKASADNGRLPTLVRLAKGEIQERASLQLQQIVQLHCDTHLDSSRALLRLLDTLACMVIRFNAFKDFPTALWRLTRKWNVEGAYAAYLDFLEARAEQLDAGYSQQLQIDAFRKGGGPGVSAGALQHLLSDGVQDEIVGALTNGSASNLDAERAINRKERMEGRRGQQIKSVARASRDGILQDYRCEREAAIASHVASKRQNVKRFGYPE